MDHTILGKVFSLINKTGDRCIVLSEEHNEAYAVMSLAEYERLAIGKSEVASLTEDELLDRINRDIAVWKSQQGDAEDRRDDFDAHQPSPQPSPWEGEGISDLNRDSWDEDSWDEDEDGDEDPYYFEAV